MRFLKPGKRLYDNQKNENVFAGKITNKQQSFFFFPLIYSPRSRSHLRPRRQECREVEEGHRGGCTGGGCTGGGRAMSVLVQSGRQEVVAGECGGGGKKIVIKQQLDAWLILL